MTRAAFAAGLPAPEVFGEVTLQERFGIVLSRLDGPTLLQHYRSGAITFEQAGAILATLAISVHKTPPPPDVLSLHEYLDESFRLSGGMLPKHFATGILGLIERLPPGGGWCHGDLHPGNVIMTAEGPRTRRLDRRRRRARRLRPWVLSRRPLRARRGRRRRPEAAACGQCCLAVRIRAAGRHIDRGADGGDGALPANRLRPVPPRWRVACRAGAADAAHRSGPALTSTP